jgi:hypothetical protein
MKAAEVLVSAFMLGLLMAPVGLTLIAQPVSPGAEVSTSGKSISPSIELPISRELLSNQVMASSSDTPPNGVASEATVSLQGRPWTVLVYLDADNDLQENAFDDLNTMELVGSTADVAILAYVDFGSGENAPFAGAECYYVIKDTNMSEIASLTVGPSLPTNPNMGDPNTLLQLITYAQGALPAENYLLVLWDHGAGFYGVCVDETNDNDRLLPGEISDVLANGAVQFVDIVAFDACLMGQLEVAYELRSDTELIVFSEESVPDTGFPYEQFLQDLVDHHSWTPAQLASDIVSRYNGAYAAGGIYYNAANPDTEICLSAVNGSRLVGVASALDNLTLTLLPLTSLRANYEAICEAYGATQNFIWPDFVDLADFALQLDAAFLSAALSNSSLRLRTAALAAVYFEQHLSGLPDATGLGLAFSTHGGIPLELLTNTHYEEFMQAFQGLGDSSATALTMSTGGTHYGYLDGEDDDVFYRFTPDASTTFSLRLDSMREYDEDFDLYLYDGYLNLLEASEGYTSTEYVEYNFVAKEVYYIRVHSYADSDIEFGLGAFRLTVLSVLAIDPVLVALFIIAIVVIILIVVCIVRTTRHGWLGRWERSSVQPRQPAGTPATSSTPSTSTSRAGFCTNCGAVLPMGVLRCPSCGHPVD